MALAFELPDHLPRGALAPDKSTHVLTKVGQATNKTLNATLASSWLTELDSAIDETKDRIFRKIHEDLPAFKRQLESSTSVQARLGDLRTTTDRLSDSLNNPETGTLPTLLQTLTAHKSLSEQTNDSNTIYLSLAHLLCIRQEFNKISALVERGELPESAQICVRLHKLISEAPGPLDRAEIMADIKKRYRAVNDRVQEQLGDAYARSVLFSSSADAITLTLHPSTRVLPTSIQVALPAILQSLTPDSLSTRLSAFRRDLMAKVVEPILLSSRVLTTSMVETAPTLCLSLSSASDTPLQSLRTLTTFLNSQFFPHLPSTQSSFPTTFHAPITSAILTHLLKPSIPSSLTHLPSFLAHVDDAVRFEETLSPTDSRNRPIRQWVEDVPSHYEKKRRESVLLRAREIVGKPEDGATSRIQASVTRSSRSPTRVADNQPDAGEIGWDFDEEDIEGNAEDAPTSRNMPPKNSAHDDVDWSTNKSGDTTIVKEDASDAWGWGDDVDDEADGVAASPDESSQGKATRAEEDGDPWDDDGWSAQPDPPLSLPTAPELEGEPSFPVPQRAPKMAKRLERFSAKTKGLSAASTPVASPTVSTVSQQTRAAPPQQETQETFQHSVAKKFEEKETYLVSVRAKMVLEIAREAMREGEELLHSKVFAEYLSGKTTIPGQLLVAAAPSVLDLHRALYPIAHSSSLARDPNLAMRWSNDCRFLSDEVLKLGNLDRPAVVEERWVETGDRLKMLGEAWFEDVVVRQQEVTKNFLVRAQGFAQVSDQERFQECKGVMEQILHEMTSVAQQWKDTLTKSMYLRAIGEVVDDVLFRVMDDILSLEDIPEADSERLSELCELLAPLEELFVYVPGERSLVGSHVPLWFKFSYLSWLVKGSIADLSYLFDQGMLVDYEIDELMRLLRALFAETPLRENTIAKITRGHPISDQRDDP